MEGLLDECRRAARALVGPQRPTTMADFALARRSGPYAGYKAMTIFRPQWAAMPYWQGLVPAVPAPQPKANPVSPVPAAAPQKPPQLSRHSNRLAPAAADAHDKLKVLQTWVRIVGTCGSAVGIHSKLPVDFGAEDLVTHFGRKATGTMSTHGSAWTLFLEFLEETGRDPQLIDEEVVYSDLQSLKASGAAPTRGTSILKACNFAIGVCAFRQVHLLPQAVAARV